MNASACHLRPLPPPPPPFSHRPKLRPTSAPCPPWSTSGAYRRRAAVATRCVSQGGWGSVAELERELAAEVSLEEGEEWLKLGRLKEKCGGGKGVVELLECLEREAIMGEDEGRDSTDYNRRAKIFSTSSRVFQALKQHSDAASHHS